MTVLEAIRNRRTVRNFRPDPIPEETVRKLLEAAAWAPSHRNIQPWQFTLIGPKTRAKLLPQLQKMITEGPLNNPDLPEQGRQLFESFMQDFGGAPLLLAVTSLPPAVPPDRVENPLAAAAAVENLLLAAWEQNIGGAWLSLGLFPDTAKNLGIGEGHSVIAVLALGYFDSVPPAPPRESVDSKLTVLP